MAEHQADQRRAALTRSDASEGVITAGIATAITHAGAAVARHPPAGGGFHAVTHARANKVAPGGGSPAAPDCAPAAASDGTESALATWQHLSSRLTAAMMQVQRCAAVGGPAVADAAAAALQSLDAAHALLTRAVGTEGPRERARADDLASAIAEPLQQVDALLDLTGNVLRAKLADLRRSLLRQQAHDAAMMWHGSKAFKYAACCGCGCTGHRCNAACVRVCLRALASQATRCAAAAQVAG